MSARRIASLKTASSDVAIGILNDTSESIRNNEVSNEELLEICDFLHNYLDNSPPSVTRGVFSLLSTILETECSQKVMKSIFNLLKAPLSNPKAKNREIPLEISKSLMKKMSPFAFWQSYSDLLSSKAQGTRESALSLMLETINYDESFKLGPNAKVVIQLLTDSAPDVRQKAFEIISVLYSRKPVTITSLLNKQLGDSAKDVLNKLTGQRKKVIVGSYTVESSQQSLNPDDIKAELAKEFVNAGLNTEPYLKTPDFKAIERRLVRSNDWKDRVAALDELLAISKGNSGPAVFIRGFRSIQDPFIECLTDARSSLAKAACLSLVGIARSIGSSLDSCSDFILPPLFGRCNHATAIIALSSSFAIEEYAESVQGKRTKSVIITYTKAAAPEARVVAYMCALKIKDKWPTNYREDIDKILDGMKSDQSPQIRELALEYESKQTPAAPQVQPTQNNENRSLLDAIEAKDTDSIIKLLSNPELELQGLEERIIEILLMEMNLDEGDDKGLQMLQTLTTHRNSFLLRFLNTIISELPSNQIRGIGYISHLENVYGKKLIASKLLTVPLPYPLEHLLDTYDHTDPVFGCQIISSVILNGFYSLLHSKALYIMKQIYESDPIIVEALIGSLDKTKKSVILEDICVLMPGLYAACRDSTDLLFGERILEALSSKKSISSDILTSSLSSSAENLLLAIAAVRESDYFESYYVSFLIQAIKYPDVAISSSAVNTLCQWSSKESTTFSLIVDSFFVNPGVIKALSLSLHLTNKEDAAAALMKLQQDMINALGSVETKYSVLNLVAVSILLLGEDFSNYLGELSDVNKQLLQSMIEVEKRNAKVP